jgi:hypothetical protein
MNIQQWLTPLLKMGKKKRNNGKGMIWASIISLIVSVIALRRLNKGENVEGIKNPIGSLMTEKGKTVDIQKFLTMKDRTVLAEFANELAPKTNPIEHKVEEKINHNNTL